MLDDKDIKKIGEEMGKVIEQNVTPTLDDLRGDLDNLRGEMKDEFGKIKSQMVTKSYLDDKLADLEGGLVVKLRKEDAKVDHLVKILKEKKIISDQDVKCLAEFQIFPKTS